jgi:hypothetical protein
MTTREVCLVLRDQKIVREKNGSAKDDHGERCHRFGPFMRHEDFKVDGEYIELHSSRKFCVLTREGDPDFFFTEAPVGINLEGDSSSAIPVEIQDMIEHGICDRDDIEIARNLMEIDDDNEPAPENVPQANERVPENVFGEWGHHGMCHRRMENARNQNPSINFPVDVRPTLLQLFELLFPKTFILFVILPMINKEISIGGPVEYGEFLRFIGIWFLMATIQGPHRRDYWSIEPVSRYQGAPFRINEMSRTQFDEILRCL